VWIVSELIDFHVKVPSAGDCDRWQFVMFTLGKIGSQFNSVELSQDSWQSVATPPLRPVT